MRQSGRIVVFLALVSGAAAFPNGSSAAQDVLLFVNRTGVGMRVEIAVGDSELCDENNPAFLGVVSSRSDGGRRVLLNGSKVVCWRVKSGTGWTGWQKTRCVDSDPNKLCTVVLTD